VKYAWIKDQSSHPVRTLCRMLAVSASGYYAWRQHRPSARAVEDARLVVRIKQVHVQARQAYGTQRLWRALCESGEICGRHRVRRLQREHVIYSKRRRRYLRTRSAYQRMPAAPNLLAWPFSSAGPGRVWVADITYIPTREGWLYLAVVEDLYSRRLVGWSMADTMTSRLVVDALEMAVARRLPQEGLLAHSDRGSQYASEHYQQLLGKHGIETLFQKSYAARFRGRGLNRNR